MTGLDVSKYQGTGNDFVMLLDLEGRRPLSAALAAALCDRRTGVGADGAIRVAPDPDGADVFMDYRNADGSLAEMCGNGIRCVAAFLADRGHGREELTVGTRAGRRTVTTELIDGRVASATVGMGAPDLDAARVPMRDASGSFLGRSFSVGGRDFTASAVSMGNPHLVLFLDGPADDELVGTAGPAIERDARFPEGVNVEFVTVVGGDLVARVWERGIGETRACGTGACAALVAANEAGLVDATATVRFPGGDLLVERAADQVYLTGTAERSFDATIPTSWLHERGLA